MAEEKWRILGKLMNTHGRQAHMHSHNPPTHFLSSLWGFPTAPLLPSPAAVSMSSHSVLWLIPYHRVRIYLTARVRRPHSRLMQKRANTITPNIHPQTDRGNRHPAHVTEVAKAWWLVAGGCLQTTVILPSWQRAARTFLHSAKLSAWHLQSAKHRNAAAHDNCGGLFSASRLMWGLVEANGMNY